MFLEHIGMGIPFKSEDGTHSEWLPPAEFYAIRAGQGPSILILEEMSDAGMNMQNPLCRVILDRHAGQMKLSEQLFIIATGNRVEDKSGANRLSTKLGNRVRNLDFTSSVDDWIDWALAHEISPMLVGFIRFRPALLSDFDPKRSVNPTPRSWEDVSRVPESLGAAEYFEHIKGAVGEGAAAEYTQFLKVAQKMPDIKKVLKEPEKAEVPTEPSVMYAVIGALESTMDKKNAEKVFTYIMRFPAEFTAMFMCGAYRRDKSIVSNKFFREWAIKNGQMLRSIS